MAEEKDEGAVASLESIKNPRYFDELNAVFAVKGMNLTGFGVGILLCAFWMGLQLWLLVLPTMMLATWLARKLAKEPTLVQEIGGKVRSLARTGSVHRWQVPGEERPEPIEIVLPNGRRLQATDWMQYRVALENDVPGVYDFAQTGKIKVQS